MECALPGSNIRVFSKMIQCMQKIGEEVLFLAGPDNLVMRALNNARSAYFQFTLHRDFFDSYEMRPISTNPGATINCRLLIKACLAVFRSALNQVDICKISISEDGEQMIFSLLCKQGVKKTYKLNVEECEPLQAVYDKSQCHNRISARAKTLNDVIQNYPSSIEEIAFYLLTGSHAGLIIKSHIDENKPEDQLAKILRTEATIGQTEFELWEIQEPLELVFSLKEMKALLAFCEAVNQNVAIFMSGNGKPLLVAVKCSHAFTADFVLATVFSKPEDEDSSQASSAMQVDQSSGQPPSSGVSSGRNAVGSYDPQSGQSGGYNYDNDRDVRMGGTPSGYGGAMSDAGLLTPPGGVSSENSGRRQHEDMSAPSSKRSPQGALWDDGDDYDMADIGDDYTDVPASPEN